MDLCGVLLLLYQGPCQLLRFNSRRKGTDSNESSNYSSFKLNSVNNKHGEYLAGQKGLPW